MTRHSTNHNRGFTLIELALVLFIAGLLIGGGVSGFTALKEGNIQRRTDLSFERIGQKLSLFALEQGRLPCPAADINGNEQASCGGNDGYGLIPFEAIDLAPADMRDGWGRLIRYAVDPDLTHEDSLPCDNAALLTPTGSLALRDANDTESNVAFMLLSHGKNGHGALMPSGTPYAESATAARPEEFENSSNGDPLLFYYESASGSFFDDKLYSRNAADLLYDTGCRYTAFSNNNGNTGGPGNDTADIGFDNDSDDDGQSDALDFIVTPENSGQGMANPILSGSGTTDDPYSFALGTDDGNYRSCLWWPDNIDFTGKVIRAYVAFSMEEDPTGNGAPGNGFTLAFLPGTTTVSSTLCGGRGANMGYRSSGGEDLPSPRFGVEVDTAFNLGNGFYDPANNHTAILFDSNTHTDAFGPRCRLTVGANPVPGTGTPGLGEGCYPGPVQNWLEDGDDVWHSLRIEVHSPGYATAAGHSASDNPCMSDNKPMMRVWINNLATDCSNCDDLSADRHVSPTLQECLPTSEATQDSLKFGFTHSSTGPSGTITLTDFGLGSFSP